MLDELAAEDRRVTVESAVIKAIDLAARGDDFLRNHQK